MIGFGDPVFARDESKEPELLVISLRNYASYFRGDVGDLDALSKGLPRLPETADELRAVAYAVGAGNNAIKLRQVASERTVKGARLDGLWRSLLCHSRTGGRGNPVFRLKS